MVKYNDDSSEILLIQELVNAKIANSWDMNTHSHWDFALSILQITHC